MTDETAPDGTTTARMATAAADLLAALDPARRRAAHTSLDAPDRREWTYLPGPRPGLSLGEMTVEQRERALALLDTGGGAEGRRLARGVIDLERIRRELATGRPVDDDRYWFRILGEPGGPAPWGWRVNGHHLAVHVLVAGGELTVTPYFLGAEPAVVLDGPHRGRRLLTDEEELARSLLAALDPDQRARAVAADLAPADILTGADPVADPSVLPSGLSHADMTTGQRESLLRLIRRYVERAPEPYARRYWQGLSDAGLGRIEFAWAGPARRGAGHYYCVTGPTLLIEYDNTQDDANHIHSVWRDRADDWGEDLLRRHRREHH
ncbi:DUF3500 domain-containing protein [Plantactinospora sp. GCM10030261]|uniref:DUF3500 domain-containing protein n=1 Tax=Plantactinospora sp. GCM10030261 TaxID=3273420 RepID=UPI0036225A42